MPAIVGDPSATASATLSVVDWWLINPDAPASGIKLGIIGETLETANIEDQGEFAPLGRDRDVVVSDVFRGERFTLNLYFRDQAEYDAFETMRRLGKALLLKSDMGQQWWIRLGANRRAALLMVGGRVANPKRRIAIDAVEVNEPAEA